MTDHEIKDMLERQAASITPATDGLERIEAKLTGEVPVTGARTARRFPMPVLAAAAIIVVALIGAVLYLDRDDTTQVASGDDITGGFAPYPQGVWPWPGDDVSGVDLTDPVETATAYIGARIHRTDGTSFRTTHETGSSTVTVTGGVSTTVFLAQDGDRWYVESAASDLVTLHDAGDGTVTARVETGGELTRTTAIGDQRAASGDHATVQGGEEYLLDGDVGPDDAPRRELFVLDTVDGTIGITELAFAPPTAGSMLEAVWPSNDPDVLNGISASWARESSPLEAVKLYLVDRVGEVGLTDEDISIVTGDDGATAIVTVTGPIATEVQLRRLDGDGPWYVREASSGLLGRGTLTFDGTEVHSSVLVGADGMFDVTAQTPAGPANEAGGSQEVTAEQQVDTVFTVADDQRDEPALAVHTVLRNGDVVALDERLVYAPPSGDDTATTSTTVVAASNTGVWPKGSDDVDDETLSDPVSTAARYLADTVGTTESTILSDFRQGDTTSGEVEVSGDITATILLRELDGRWHVEAVISDLVEAIEGAPGEVRLIAKQDGVLSILALDADGTVVTSMPNGGVVKDQEVLVVPNAPAGTPLTVRWKLQTPMNATGGDYDVTALGDVSLYGGAYSEHPVPDGAISDEGGLDARETAVAYLDDRLGGRTVTVNDATIDGETAEVSWEAGIIELTRSDGYWYVVEAIGDSIQIEGPKELRLAQAGTVHVSINGVDTFDIRNDENGEGTVVHIDHEVPDEPFVMRAVFETDTGFVSLAERAIT